MGGRAGGGAGFGSRGGGGMSDAAIERLASSNQTFTTKDLNPINEPRLLSGEWVMKSGSFDGGRIVEVHSPKIEHDVGVIAESTPAKPNSNSKKAKAAYLKAYNTWAPKMDAAYDKAISGYKTEIGKTKNKAAKYHFSKQVQKYQGWKKDLKDVSAWINRVYS